MKDKVTVSIVPSPRPDDVAVNVSNACTPDHFRNKYATIKDLIIWVLEEGVDLDSKILISTEKRGETHFHAAEIGHHIQYSEVENSVAFRFREGG